MLFPYPHPGTLTLSASQPSFQEPLTLPEVKSFLRVETVDEDDLIAIFISAAREQAELFQHRTLVRKSFDLTLSAWPYAIELPSPFVSVDLVQATGYDGTTTPLVLGTGYHVCGAYVHPLLSTYATSLLIRFTAGYTPDDPFWFHAGARLKAGMLLLISQWYSNRLPFAVGAVSELPFAVTHCLSEGARKMAR